MDKIAFLGGVESSVIHQESQEDLGHAIHRVISIQTLVSPSDPEEAHELARTHLSHNPENPGEH